MDVAERLYIGGLALLQAFVVLFPIFTRSKGDAAEEGSTMEFLPLMITSVYCAIGLTWAFLRLSFIYLRYYAKN